MAPTASHLLERDTQLASLRALVSEPDGAFALVVGAAGTGKSALLDAVADEAAHTGIAVLRAAGAERERRFGFGAARQLVEPVLGRASRQERAELLKGAAAPAAWIAEPVADGHVDASFAVVHGITWLLTNLAGHEPLLVLVDDAHWCDDASVAALDHLARRLAGVPIALVVALRPDEPGAPAELLDALREQPHARVLRTPPLSPSAAADVVRRRHADAGDELCASFHSASAGNPLYLIELLRSFGADAAPDAVRNAGIPTLGERLIRRVARVDSRATDLAAAMAVLGEGRLETAARLAGLSTPDAARIAQRLARIEVLASEDPFTFTHPLVRGSVEDALTVTERDALHRAAAELLARHGAPVQERAAHLAALRPGASAEVAVTLREAAADALARAAPVAAIALLRRALAEAAPAPPRAALLADLGRAELVVRDPACAEHLGEAFALEQDLQRRAGVAVTLIELLSAAGLWEQSIAVGEQMLAVADELDLDVVTELATAHGALCHYDPRLVERFDAQLPWLRELAARDGRAARALSALLAAAAAQHGAPAAEVAALVDRARGEQGYVDDRGGGGWATVQAIGGLLCIDDLDGALAMAAAIEAVGRRTGSALMLLTGPGIRGTVTCLRGDLLAAEAELGVITEILAQADMSMWSAQLFHSYCDVLLERPSVAALAAQVEDIQLDGAFAETFTGAFLLVARGRLRRDRGLEDLRRGAALYRTLRIAPTWAPWRSLLALALPRGERDEARDLVDEELELARRSGVARAIGVALRADGLLTGDLDRLAESVAVLEDSPARLELARSQAALGAALRRANQRAQARAVLTDALDLAHRCGAQRLVDQVAEELRAAGARPRRAAQTGVEALTASELRVARLAADGRTNAEIAQALYVTVKTVDTHLTRAYAKLRLSGQGARQRLRAALDEP